MKRIYQVLSVVAAVSCLVLAWWGHGALTLAALTAVLVWAGKD